MIFHIYGSGDTGSSDLVSLCVRNNVPYMFFDIRTSHKGVFENLIFLMQRGLITVPQVFRDDETYVGNLEMATGAMS